MVSKSLIQMRKEGSNAFLFIDASNGNPKGMKTNCCPFCDTKTESGSWSPETCPDCGAVYFFNAWTRDI